VGDAKPFIGALIALDPAMLPGWLAGNGLPEMGVEEAAQHPQVRAELDRAVAEANETVSRAESIRAYAVLPRQLTEEEGELSASLKVRRPVVLEHFAEHVAKLYA
jgi:long-chain acyl-CoA synthetase